MKFYDMTDKKTWETKYRYSELKDIHEALLKTSKIKLPKFP